VECLVLLGRVEWLEGQALVGQADRDRLRSRVSELEAQMAPFAAQLVGAPRYQ